MNNNPKTTPKVSTKTTISADSLTKHTAILHRFFGAGGFGGLLPNPDVILRRMGRADVSVYRDLLGDPVVAGAVRRRKSAVSRMQWRLDGQADEQTLDLLQSTLADLDIYRLIGSILDAVLYGYQPMEIIWEQGSYWLPKAIIAKPQEWFGFDHEGQLILTQGTNHAPVLSYKFLCPTHNASFTNPYGTGDLSCVYWATIFKRGGLKFWAEFAEKFGSPWIIGHEPRSNTEADTQKFLDSLEELVGNAVASIPNDSSVEIKEATGKTGSSDVYDRFIRYCRSEINIALLGQDQTTEKDSTHAAASIGYEVTLDIRDNDCRVVESCINTLLSWICELNFHNVNPPKFILYDDEVGNKELAERDQILSSLGVVFSHDYYARAYNLSADDFTLTTTSQLSTADDTAKSEVSFAERTFYPSADLSDRLAVGLPSDKALQGQIKAMLSDFSTLDGIDDETALLERLSALYPSMNIDDLQDKLTQMLFITDTLSRLSVADELGADDD